MFVVVRLKGKINIKEVAERTLKMLRLNRKHSCVLVPSNDVYIGMINKVRHLVTWGEPSKEVIAEIIKKRGKLPGNKRVTEEYMKEKVKKNFDEFASDVLESKAKLSDVPGLKPVFRLKPPTKGLEKLGMKKPFSLGGSFGYRGQKIDDLLKRMI